ncbi:DUF6282 family protein [Parapedobacter koreensis]|uniref:DUF6282 family protein n=1 Tax=Parapedobacter koreensis TaxID=332977 RepID=UPI00115F9E6B|nr:DUF6282 family protein [Parapedobacter koreensis]
MSVCRAQFPEKNESAYLLQGAIDFHVHSAPDFFDRSLTDLELAELAERKGMSAFVIKNHFISTVDRAMLVNSRFEKIKAYGGVVLNRSVGGINPAAVEWMCKMSPVYGKIVWFPTLDAAFHKRIVKDSTAGLSVVDPNRISAKTIEVLKIIARENLVLATGHLSAEEMVALVKEAVRQGVANILITHCLADWPNLTHAQMTELAKAGALLELTYLSYLSGPQAPVNFLKNSKHVSMQTMAEAIKTIGAEHFIISSDLGQTGNPIPPDGMKLFIAMLMENGITAEEVRWMIRRNPARLLGIE